MALPRTKKELERAIEADKQKLQDALGRLGSTVRDEVDPRSKVASNPYRALGATFAIGFMFGALSFNR